MQLGIFICCLIAGLIAISVVAGSTFMAFYLCHGAGLAPWLTYAVTAIVLVVTGFVVFSCLVAGIKEFDGHGKH